VIASRSPRSTAADSAANNSVSASLSSHASNRSLVFITTRELDVQCFQSRDGRVLDQMVRALPALVELVAPALAGQVCDPEVVAMALVRLSVCHYLVPGSDDDRLLDQLRTAAGLP
jgi:hypothetical protein